MTLNNDIKCGVLVAAGVVRVETRQHYGIAAGASAREWWWSWGQVGEHSWCVGRLGSLTEVPTWARGRALADTVPHSDREMIVISGHCEGPTALESCGHQPTRLRGRYTHTYMYNVCMYVWAPAHWELSQDYTIQSCGRPTSINDFIDW